MREMERKQKESQNVETGHVNILKAVNHHRVNVVTIERIGFEQREAGVEIMTGEMQEVKNNKRENDEPAHNHVT